MPGKAARLFDGLHRYDPADSEQTTRMKSHAAYHLSSVSEGRSAKNRMKGCSRVDLLHHPALGHARPAEPDLRLG